MPRSSTTAKPEAAKPTAASPSTTAKRGGAARTARRARSKRTGKSKYKAKGQHIDGQWFASQAEAARYLQLKQLAADGVIDRLECQPVFPVSVNNQRVCRYVADFRYLVLDDRGNVLRSVVEDVKGMVMPLYKLKKKLVEASYGFEIVEIPASKVTQWAGRTA